MAKFIIFLDRIVNFYLYFVVMACFLSLVPNINPNYPLFNFIFKASGFYILPGFWGITFSPAVVMITLALISAGLHKIYEKFYAKNEPKVIVMSPEEFIKQIQKDSNEIEAIIENSEDKEGKENDSDQNTSSN